MPDNNGQESTADQHDQRLLEKLADMGGRLQSSIRLMSTIRNLTVIPATALNLEQAAEEVTATLVRDLDDIEGCSILIYELYRDRLRLIAAFGGQDLFVEERRGGNKELTFRPGEGVAGKAFQDNEPVFWDVDSPQSDLIKRQNGMYTPVSLACLPLVSLGRPMGVMNISFGRVLPFTNHRQRELILLSGVVANVIGTFLLKP
ncbi:MAG: GAF domain-containing protein [Proteobacteria bacterium]|nr:GAF domain-containing protein [Pseudomonadota bacterium]MBU1740317.1 GAF domain-containing protein [Pseudomonadota bacterium]